jgi:hypothetical protein
MYRTITFGKSTKGSEDMESGLVIDEDKRA